MSINTSLHHSFDINIAAEHSIEEAIIIHHFQHWIAVNKRKDINYYDDRYWTYQTYEEIADNYPYLNKNQVKYIIKKLCDKKVLIKRNFNKKKFDKTHWYAFENQKMFTKDKIVPRGDKIVSPIPDTKTKDIKTTSKEVVKKNEKKQVKFNRQRNKFDNITDDFYISLKEAAPDVDIELAFRKMIAWLMCHRNRKGTEKFVTNWILREQSDIEERNKIRNCRNNKKQEWESMETDAEIKARIEKRKEKAIKEGRYVEASPDDELEQFPYWEL